MKIKKLITAILLGAVVAASAILPAAGAAKTVGFSAEQVKAAPKMDGVIGTSEYGWGDWISLTDARLTPAAWVSGHAIDPALKVEYKFAWDSQNLYAAIKVTGDKSASQKGTADAAWFGKADCVQIFLNPEYTVTSASPVCLTVGFSENAMPVV
ncbi:MAG: hypothetical protein J6C52_13960, partial [Clostridia bacterium]|nr:hypothetical protein [Clostridia bacterium]